MAFKMKGTAMYNKMMVDGKSSMQLKKEFGGPMEMSHMKKSPMDHAHGGAMNKSPMDHKKDSAGIKHGNEGHLKPADDVSTRGQGAADYYKNNPGSALNHSEDSAGIKHGNAGHLKPADDVSNRGQAASEYYKNNPGSATRLTQDAAMKLTSALKKSPMDSQGLKNLAKANPDKLKYIGD